MTTSGGEEGRTAASSRRFDWVAALAWTAAAVIAIALAGLAAVGFQAIVSKRQAFADWLASAEAVSHEDDVPTIEPLPGQPPVIPPKVVVQEEAVEDGKPVVIVNPSWEVRPSPEFPRLAQRKGVETGRVELQCPVAADGSIASCWILSETPEGAGFGQAALAGAVRARIRPRTLNGVATGGMVRFSTSFRLQ